MWGSYQRLFFKMANLPSGLHLNVGLFMTSYCVWKFLYVITFQSICICIVNVTITEVWCSLLKLYIGLIWKVPFKNWKLCLSVSFIWIKESFNSMLLCM